MAKRKTTEKFVEESKIIHGNKYDYSRVDYTYAQEKIIIICPEHGEFLQRACDHLNGSGCSRCKGFNKTTHEWISDVKKIHGNKYDYSKSEYSGSHNKVCIICPEHGEFWQVAKEHLRFGCNKCGNIKCGDSQRLNTLSFIEKSQKKHNYKYDYSKSEYVGYDKEIKIICPEHGEFITTPHTHLRGHECTSCVVNSLYYENKLFEKILNRYNNLKIIRQFKANWLKYKHKMSIDIFIENYNIAIEYQGAQHFKPIEHYGGLNTYKKQIDRDKLKYKLCKKNNIILLYFSYFDKEPENYEHVVYHDENELFLKIDKIIEEYENV